MTHRNSTPPIVTPMMMEVGSLCPPTVLGMPGAVVGEGSKNDRVLLEFVENVDELLGFVGNDSGIPLDAVLNENGLPGVVIWDAEDAVSGGVDNVEDGFDSEAMSPDETATFSTVLDARRKRTMVNIEETYHSDSSANAPLTICGGRRWWFVL